MLCFQATHTQSKTEEQRQKKAGLSLSQSGQTARQHRSFLSCSTRSNYVSTTRTGILSIKDFIRRPFSLDRAVASGIILNLSCTENQLKLCYTRTILLWRPSKASDHHRATQIHKVGMEVGVFQHTPSKSCSISVQKHFLSFIIIYYFIYLLSFIIYHHHW